MLKLSRFVVCMSLPVILPLVASAAGTYYNTGAQQRSYTNTSYSAYRNSIGAQGAINNGYTPYNTNARYTVGTNVRQVPVSQQQMESVDCCNDDGFYMGMNLSHEYSRWEMNMKTAGSSLHYDDVSWNVLDVNAGYKFANTSVPFQIDAGFRYGMQWDETTMIDDDITHGGYKINDFNVNTTDDGGSVTTLVATQTGHALSIGKSSDGKMMGFNVGLGLTDAFRIGKLRVTPSVGWRYLKYKLKTTDNHGLSVDTTNVASNCVSTGNGEIQCGPVIVFFQENDGYPSNQAIEGITSWYVLDDRGQPIGNAYMSGLEVPGADYFASTEGTMYYSQSGTSHEYNVAWSGPYVAMDLDYEINANNLANMRVEFGLPGYTAEGNQPYRPDWKHPNSVKDEAGILSAMHLGLAANWQTALTDSLSLSVGLTYDYYKTSKADATTNLNPSYWETQYIILEALGYSSNVGEDNYNEVMAAIDDYRADGWKIKNKEEIESIYRSLGARIGIVARF